MTAAPKLATREEVITALRISRRTWDRRIAPQIPRYEVGSRVLYDWEDVNHWLAGQRVGSFTATNDTAPTTSASGSKVAGKTSARAQRIAEKLSRAQRQSTPRLFPVGARKRGRAPETR
jgi:hypothetical protein